MARATCRTSRQDSGCWSRRAPAPLRPGRARPPTSRRSAGSTRYGASSAASDSISMPRRRCRTRRCDGWPGLLHDRMTEAVLLDDAAVAGLFAHDRAAATCACRARRRRRLRQPMPRWASRSARTRSTTSRENFARLGRDPDRRRTDDVRAGELRALPPQDLQRRFRHRWRAAADMSLFAMIRNTHARAPERRALGLPRQRRGHRGLGGPALLPGSGHRHLRRARRADRHPDEGRDAQSSDGDLAVPGRSDRLRRRDPRRGRHRYAAPNPRPGWSATRSRTCASPASSSPGSRRSASPIASSARSTS